MSTFTFPPRGVQPVVGTKEEFSAFVQEALASGKAGIAKLKATCAAQNWAGKKPSDVSVEEVLAGLDIYDEAVNDLRNGGSVASVVKESHPSEEFRTLAEENEQELEKVSTEISLDREVYDALQALSNLAGDRVDPATKHYLDKTLLEFRRSGVDRDEATRQKVKELNEEIVKIGQDFARNIRSDVLHVEVEPADLEGLPEDYVRSHKADANGKIKITTDSPDYIPFITYSKSVSAREKLWKVYRRRGYPNNLTVLENLIKKRHELATLLGYKSWAAYITENKMIKTEKNAADFIEKIADAASERLEKDYAALLERKRKDVPSAERVDPWEQAYLEDRIRAEQYSFDSQSIRPYFEYTRVKKGVLDTTSKMFNISFRKLDEKVWHEDVEGYDLLDENGQMLGRFYLDMHPRTGKYKHAAQFELVTGKQGVRLPEGVLMCNFPKPPSDPSGEPALMQHRDVETFFHEFGHLLHHILGGNTRWAGLSGVRTEWDFVETPSQILEEWAKDVGVLQTFALHYQTNEPIPADAVAKLRKADEFGKGTFVRQQMFYAAVSLNYYNKEGQTIEIDTTELMKTLQDKYTPFKYVPDTYFQLSFGHLDGYSAIYYTYMWSLVIAKDLFEEFKRHGLMNTELATKYRKAILQPGGSKPAAELVKDFLGREYGFEAYRKWLTETEE